MAEFCLECWNKINETNDSESKYVISKDLDLCEECGEWKNVIVAERKNYYLGKLTCVFYILKNMKAISHYLRGIFFCWRLNRKKNKKK